MAQILVGGDNEDAYSICDALEKKAAARSIPVVFCATPHEVLANVGRGGVVAVVLNFEQAGLTNFEVAVRIREAAGGASVPLLMPEIDALGDIGALGKQVGIFSLPVNPEAVANLVGRLMEAAAKQATAAKPPPGPRTPTRQPEAASGAAQAPSDARRAQAGPVVGPLEGEAAAAPAAEGRTRRVRHRTWNEIRQERRGGQRNPAPSAEIDDEDIVVTTTRAPAARARFAKLGAALLAVALAVGAYYGVRAMREAAGGGEAVPAVALTELKCSACGAREGRPAVDIHAERCRQCGGTMGLAYRCNDCKTEFAFVPAQTVKRLRDIRNPPECPKCKSWNTTVVQPPATAPR